MAPTCESCGKTDGAAAAAALVPDPCDTAPFHGMFESHEEAPYDPSSSTSSRNNTSIAVKYQAVPRHVIPEASETFLRVMRQLDSAEEEDLDRDATKSSTMSSSSGTRPKGPTTAASATCEKAAPRERKSIKVVKKSASFSTQHGASTSLRSCPSASVAATSSSNSKKDAGCRRLSVPCTRKERHVQWADQVGAGAQLVSVRLIRPRLEVKDDEKASSPARSILRRLGVVAKDDKPVSEERSLFRRLGVGRR